MQVKRSFIRDPSLVLDLPLYELDGREFTSRDAYGHLCTVTGVTWGSQGRTFDGIDDKISCGSNSSLDLSIWSIEVRFKCGVAAKGTVLLDMNTDWSGPISNYQIDISATGKVRGYYGYTTGWTNGLVTSDKDVTDSLWHHVFYSYNGSRGWLWVDENIPNYVDVVDTPKQTTANILYLGAFGGVGAFFAGTIGEVRIYNRVLFDSERSHNYQATKWTWL